MGLETKKKSRIQIGKVIAGNFIFLPLTFTLLIIAIILASMPIFPTKNALRNLKTYGGYSFINSWILVIGVYSNYFIYVVEALFFWPLGFFYVEGTDDLAYLLQKCRVKYNTHKGFAFLSAHFGHLEVMAEPVESALLQVVGKSYIVLAKSPHSQLAKYLLDKYRSMRKASVLWTGARSLLLEMEKAAQNGYSLGFLADQKPKSQGIFIRFFGSYAAFPGRGIEIAIRQGMPLVHIVPRRIIPGWFTIECAEGNNTHLDLFNSSDLPYHPAEIAKQDEHSISAHALAGLAGWLESIIRKSPYQWSWDYRKWSRCIKEGKK